MNLISYGTFNHKRPLIKWVLCFLFAMVLQQAEAQTFYYLKGFVNNEKNEPMPFVNIRVRGENYGTTTDEQGRYTLKLEVGFYPVVYSFVGYETQVHNIHLNQDVAQNIWLQETSGELNEVVVRNKRRDVAWEVMKNASEARQINNRQFQGSICKVYLKASEITETELHEKKSVKWKNKDDSISVADTVKPDPKMALVESQLTRYYQYPDKYKEIRDAYSRRGNIEGLYYTSTTESDLNFYENLLFSPAISDNMLLSPLSPTAQLAYKFKLIQSYYEDHQKIYHIKVSPRKTGNALFEGEIWINDSTWSIHAIDFTLDKVHMKEYDYFRIKQTHQIIKDSFRVVTKQEFIYQSKQGKGAMANGRTLAVYSDFQFNPVFEPKFFNRELSVTTKEALNRDTGYWNLIRPIPLSKEEQQFVAKLDSIKEARSKKEYLDSIDSIYNRITPQKLLWLGQGHINRKKELQFSFAPLSNTFNPVMIGGPRAQYYTNVFKRFTNRKYISVTPMISYGFRNQDFQGSFWSQGMYNTFRRSTASFSVGRNFDLINPYDAYINLLKRSNFYLNDHFSLGHGTEVFNGFYIQTSLDFQDRKSLRNYKFGETADQIFENNNILEFNPYRAITTELSLSFTPYQKYIRQPLEKVILGSSWPTFGFSWRKGYNGFLNSQLDFDFIEASIAQQITLGVFGQSNYRVFGGKFVNTRNIPYIDNKFMRRGDPFLFTSPMATFQLLDSTFTTFDWFIEAHYLHHFQGALINKIPFLIKSGVKEVAGASAMYCFDQNYQHAEVFFGLERVFRVWNDRFRLGVYYALSESNKYKPNHGIKFSVEYYNKRTNRWNF